MESSKLYPVFQHCRKKVICCFILCLSSSAAALAEQNGAPAAGSADTRAFMQSMIEQHEFDATQLQAVMEQAKFNQDVLNAIQRPWEARPWYQYYPIFLTEQRLLRGLQFWSQHAASLAKAEQIYGVPASIIVAIIGVETNYGQHMGQYPVLDALYTLGFYYPPRQDFFRKELAEYLLLSREEGFTPGETMGSYAGAMGLGQFISSSYRHYAIDFDGDGVRDLLSNPVDAIGSVANYFKASRWQAGGVVAVPAQVARHLDTEPWLQGRNLQLNHSVAELAAAGIRFEVDVPPHTPARLFAFQQKEHIEYWVGLPNFYSITRYNHSPLYAMAVYQLSLQLEQHFLSEPSSVD
ncbi:lytic murein transglycosylase B [Alkalimonas sp.]|uniref:lytic murein transglycosylase B n=1 Tax=Alkalimonas sp. TaxID=1872453 RepID=UPI00263BC5A5|nr:lytic murein transglycosylase B [Alkalimonas sp.]MCC5827214.1 lytic murein transglycosylase B [Alkalimonas sp.]